MSDSLKLLRNNRLQENSKNYYTLENSRKLAKNCLGSLRSDEIFGIIIYYEDDDWITIEFYVILVMLMGRVRPRGA